MRENPKLTYHIRGIGSIWFDMVRCRGRRPLNGTRTREHEPGNPPLSDGSDIRILLYDGSDVGAPYLAPSCPGKGPRTRSANSRIRHALSHLGAGLRIGRPRGRDRWRGLTSPLQLGRKRLCKLSLHSTQTHTHKHSPCHRHSLTAVNNSGLTAKTHNDVSARARHNQRGSRPAVTTGKDGSEGSGGEGGGKGSDGEGGGEGSGDGNGRLRVADALADVGANAMAGNVMLARRCWWWR